MVIALIMAGGRGSRMNSIQEKPLIEFRGKPMILHIIYNLQKSSNIERIIVATSPHTRQTKLLMRELGVEVIDTPGRGYVEDMEYITSRKDLEDQILLTVVSDIPLVTVKLVDQVIKSYQDCGKPAMSVMIPVETFYRNGLKPSIVWQDLVPSGLNILRGKDNQQDEELLILDEIELAYNINSVEDIISLEKMGER
jgi:adenosylcobinamide-phosphate guanylyltransferase